MTNQRQESSHFTASIHSFEVGTQNTANNYAAQTFNLGLKLETFVCLLCNMKGM